jgi:hypothetical protein
MAGDSTDVERQLAWEASWRMRAAVGAGTGAALTLAASVITFVVNRNAPTVGLIQALGGTPSDPRTWGALRGVADPKVSPRGGELAFVNSHAAGEIASGLVWAIAAVGIALALFYLQQATRARRPEMAPVIRPLVIGAPIAAGLFMVGIETGFVFQVVQVIKAHSFVHGVDHSHHAVKQARGDLLTVVSALGLASLLALAFAFVFLCLNAMRIGLLTRFMGVAGMFSGFLFVIPVAPVPILQIFWLAAAGVLFAGRWPSGTPPAWQTGRAEPWPSQQQVREEREAARREREGLPPPEPKAPEPVPAGAGSGSPAPVPGPHPTSKKRKRKRRR